MAINAAGAANRNAQQAVANFAAGQGGGGNGLQTGIERQLQAAVAGRTANQLATTQNQITADNYATGRDNYWRSIGGSQALAGQFNPAEFSSEAQRGYDSSFGMADKISQEENNKQATIGGLIAKGIMTGATFGAGGVANLGAGESFSEGLGDFFKGGLTALTDQNG